MSPIKKRVIDENPNLSSAALARFLGLSKSTVARYREKPLWTHRGHGIPFVTEHRAVDGIYLTIRHQERNIANGKLGYILENLDRLIFALENGGMPPTFNDWVFKDLEFLK